MFDGMAQTIDKSRQGGLPQIAVTRFADSTYDIGALIGGHAQRFPALDERSTPALLWPSDTLLAETGASRAAAIFEGNDRFSKPLLAVSAALIGFATMLTGSFSRFGLWRQIAVASALMIALFFLANITDEIAAQNADLVAVAYVPALVGFAVSGALLGWAGRRRRVAPTALPTLVTA